MPAYLFLVYSELHYLELRVWKKSYGKLMFEEEETVEWNIPLREKEMHK